MKTTFAKQKRQSFLERVCVSVIALSITAVIATFSASVIYRIITSMTAA